jgi:large subunit ribosomal protein L31
MKEKIHPQYRTVQVTCACGETFLTGTTKNVDSLRIDVCSKCHPYFTGKQKMVETGGRIDKFNKRYNRGN